MFQHEPGTLQQHQDGSVPLRINSSSSAACFSTSQEPYDSDKMAAAFSAQFARQAFTVGQQLVFAFENKKLLGLVVKSMQGECACRGRIGDQVEM